MPNQEELHKIAQDLCLPPSKLVKGSNSKDRGKKYIINKVVRDLGFLGFRCSYHSDFEIIVSFKFVMLAFSFFPCFSSTIMVLCNCKLAFS